MSTVVIILPTYNERDNIERLIAAIFAVTKHIVGFSFKLLIVDDMSPDSTGDIVARLAKKNPSITLLTGKKMGLGAAYLKGMHYAIDTMHADIIMQMDADWSHNPDLIPLFIKRIQGGDDFVVGSRYIKGGAIPDNWGLHRKLFSVIGNLWVRFGLGIFSPHDWSSGYRIMRAGVFERVYQGLTKYSGYTFQIAFLHRVKQAGFKVSEIPLVFVDRVAGRSKFPAFEYIQNVVLYVLNNSTVFKYLVVGVVGFSIQTIAAKLLVLIGIFPGLAVGIGAFFAIIANFLGNNLWTFSHKKLTGLWVLLRKFVHFLTTSIGALIIQITVVSGGVLVFGHDAWFILMIFAIGFLVIPYNYFIYNKFIWKTHEKISNIQ